MDSARAVRNVVVLALVVVACDQRLFADVVGKYSLHSERRAGEVTRVEVALQVGGDLKLVSDGKKKTLPMSVVANLTYDEQLLALDGELPVRSIRFYDEARAVIKVDKGGETPALDPGRRLIAVEKPARTAPVLYCPAAALSREELDLVDVPGNTLLVDRLLPTEPLAVGESWKLSDQTLADLLCLEAVSWTDVKSVFNQIADGVAEITSAGSLSGAVGGVSTEIQLKAKCRFDLNEKRITYLALLIKEKRAVGHIGPGLDTVAKLIVKINPAAGSDNLTAEAIDNVPAALSPELSNLSYTAQGGQFHLLHDRRWFLTSDDPKLAVFRLVDRGELVAQCNISAIAAGQKKLVTLAEFQRDVQNSLGKNFGQFASASQTTHEAGYTVLRVVARGAVSQLPIEWVYYLIADGKGHKVSLAFTLEESLQDRFAQSDRALANAVRLAEPKAETAAKPSRQK
jgi:hypothetical protein